MAGGRLLYARSQGEGITEVVWVGLAPAVEVGAGVGWRAGVDSAGGRVRVGRAGSGVGGDVDVNTGLATDGARSGG